MIKMASVLAHELVERHWWKITVLARALLANGRIVEKEEIEKLLGKPSKPEIAMSDLAYLVKQFSKTPEIAA